MTTLSRHNALAARNFKSLRAIAFETSGLSTRLLKRLFDVVVSSLLLVFASLPIMVLAVMIRRDGGRAFYGHSCIGMLGRKFDCLKFCSMAPDSEALLMRHLANNPEARKEWESDHKLRDDPRVTRLGKFLRSRSLDELPQLLNVLKGDMILVGPRPIVSDEIARYESDIAHYYRVRPGIAGLWQVSGRSDVTYEQRVQMYSLYVCNWSL